MNRRKMNGLGLMAALLPMLGGGSFPRWPGKEEIPLEDLETEYKLIQAKKSKLSRSQRDAVERMYRARVQEQ